MVRGCYPARRLGWMRKACALLSLGALGLVGCPHQELAPLLPCTVSTVSLNAAQSGTDQVDLLFVIDNSASMAEEQVKLNAQLSRLVQALTSGDLDGVPNQNGVPDFRPVGSLRLGVVSVDLGSNGITGVRSCGSNSFLSTEQDTSVQGVDNVDRPFGDNGQLLNSTAVAVSGVSVQNLLGGGAMQTIAPRPECGTLSLPPFLEYPTGGTAADIAAQFGCIAELGVNGCVIEQQLESMLKALAPSTDVSFSRGSSGQGTPAGYNAGFLRPEAILAIILVSDEDDCSSPDSNAQALYSSLDVLTINNQCGSNPDLLQPVDRYIQGLKSLKPPAYEDRVIFAGIVGVPRAAETRGESLTEILARPDMQYVQTFLGARPACTAPGGAGTATPARRIVQVAQGFGENGVITSICEDDYSGALDAVIAKIAGKLSGQCLPRRLQRNGDGLVDCRVVEVKPAGDASPCDPAAGRIQRLPDRVIAGVPRVACEMAQLPVKNGQVPAGAGWYYDDFSDAVSRCQTDKQRIAFSTAAPVQDGASALFECFQSVADTSAPNTRGIEAINTPCGGSGRRADTTCSGLSTQDVRLICINGACQIACAGDYDCPGGRVCSASDGGSGYCENPTCPTEAPGS